MKEQYRVLAGRVLIRPEEAKEEKTASGIIVPKTLMKEPNRGEAVIVGSFIPNEPHEIHLGDTVLYRDGAGQEVVLDDVKYRLLTIKDVLTYFTPMNDGIVNTFLVETEKK